MGKSIEEICDLLYGTKEYYDDFVNRITCHESDDFEKEHHEFLIVKHGKEVVDAYDKIHSKWENAEDTIQKDKIYEKMLYFVYESGLCDNLDPEINLRGKTTLEHILKHLSIKKKLFNVLDLGSGEGKIDIGVALGIKNAKMIYAVDNCLAAQYRLKENISKLSDEDKNYVQRKIVPIHGDFTDKKFLEKNLEKNGRPDIFILANTYLPIEEQIKLFVDFAPKNGEMLISQPISFPEETRQQAAYPPAFVEGLVDCQEYQLSEIGKEFGVSFELVEFDEFSSGIVQLTERVKFEK